MHPISFRATSISFIFMNLGNFIFLPFRFITLYSPTYTIFCILPNRVQNQAMYPVCFIITCNVHFFSHDITFLGEITCALYATEGKMVIFLISEGKGVIPFLTFTPPSIISSLVAIDEAPSQSPPPLRKLM